MSAIIGGVDELVVTPSNATYEVADNFSHRIARNVQHLLKYESHFEKVVDPSQGSYYIEKLTEELASRAWEEFLSKIKD